MEVYLKLLEHIFTLSILNTMTTLGLKAEGPWECA